MSGCCGRTRRRRAATAPTSAAERLPTNPIIGQGVVLVYIGAGPRSYQGSRGRTYHVGSSRRRLKVAEDDVEALVATGDFVEMP